jgi:hypothetical protein
VAVAAITLTACTHLVSGTARYVGDSAATQAPLVKIADLPSLIPSPDQVGTTIGASDLQTQFIYTVLDTLPPGVMSAPECNAVMTPGDESVYRGSGYRGAYGQLARDVNRHSISIDVVAFDGANEAHKLVTTAVTEWRHCTNKALIATLDGPPVTWTAYGPNKSHGVDVLIRKAQGSQGYACGRAIAAGSNIVADVLVCSPDGNAVTDQAAAVVNLILDNIPA